MANIREEAQSYAPPQTMNIADLEKVSVELELLDGSGVDNTGEKFNYKYIVVDGNNYRVPGSVIGNLKSLLLKMPSLQYFSVVKQGQGMNTRYTVIPVSNEEQVA